MYKSPVTIIESAVQQIMEEREGAIIAKIRSAFDVDVDKEELLRALQYDRGQYYKGYSDGKQDAMAELVRCKDCKYYDDRHEDCDHPGLWFEYCSDCGLSMEPNDFCSYGERKGNG